MRGRTGSRPPWRLAMLSTIVFLVTLMALPSTTIAIPSAVGGMDGTGGGTQGGLASVEMAPAFAPASGVTDLGRMPATSPLSIEVGVGSAARGGLDAYATAVNTPGNSAFHRYLTPAEVTARFGASSASLRAARAYFAQFGLTTEPSPDRFFLHVTGSAEGVGQAFGTQFDLYRAGGRTFYSHPNVASLPAGIPWAGVVGLGTAAQVRPLISPPLGPVVPRPSAGCTVVGVLPPCALWNAYNLSGLIGTGKNGTGETIGVVDAYDSAERQPQLQKDFANFTADYNLPSGGYTIAYPVPAGNSLNTTASDAWADEEALDLEWARASAPGARVVDALAANSNAALYGAVDWLVTEDQVSVISLSWGEPDVGVYNAAVKPCPNQCNASADGSYAFLHPVLAAAAAEGITVLSASGDCGAADGTSGDATNYPSSDPWVLGAGGTSLNTNASGSWSSELAWSGNATGATNPGCQNQGGSGGGFAPFPRPYWQSGTGVPALPSNRGVPDVSADAATGVPIVLEGGTYGVIGTSLSSPIWAGLIAVADQVHGQRLGFVDPALYQILRNGSYARDFHDVTSGSNGYRAGVGWDPVTGLGTPIADHLIGDLAGTAPATSAFVVDLSANRTVGPASASVSFRANASGVAGSVAFYDFVFGDGNATLSTTATASHVYPADGVYNASVVAVDSRANSTVSVPVVVVIGGGAWIVANLSANTTRAGVGTSVQFQLTVRGGVAPYLVQFDFGDGTYSIPGPSLVATHPYHGAGGNCASATVMDAALPPDGGLGGPISIAVGSAARAVCVLAPPSLGANLSANYTAADLPGDLPLRWNSSGGIGPRTAWVDAPDPYVELCQCGLFRTAGPENVTLVVNDSVGNHTSRSMGVTLYPALVGTFSTSTSSGAAPLNVTFRAGVGGGHLADANRTRWQFGDGSNGTGALVTHTYTSSGFYLATALVGDQGHGNASEAFLIDVTSGAGPVVTGSITPALDSRVGVPTTLRANIAGASRSPTILWNLSDGSSAYGASVNDTVSPVFCSVLSQCTLSGTLTVLGAGGGAIVVPFSLGPFFAGRFSALDVAGTPGPRVGTTPFRWISSEVGSGMSDTATLWTFGDGATSTAATARHVYLHPGNFTVFANLSDAGGDVWVRPEAVAINGSVIAPLLGALDPLPRVCFAPCTPAFHASATGGVSGADLFSWTFGDGGVGSGPTPSHTYLWAGVFNVSVLVTDSFGENTTIGTVLQVDNATHVGLRLSASPPTVRAGGTFSVTLYANVTCGRGTITNCSTTAVPVELDVRLNNASGAPLLGYLLRPLAPNTSRSFTIPAPALQGPFWLAAVAVGPNFTGVSVIGLSVGPPASPAATLAGPALVAVGAVVGLAAAAAWVLFERGRNRRFERPPAPTGAPSP